MSPDEENGRADKKASRFVRSGPRSRPSGKAKAKAPAPPPPPKPVELPPPLPPSRGSTVIPGVPDTLLVEVERLAQKRAEKKARSEGKAPQKPCEPGKRRKGEPLQPVCDTIEPSHAKPRGEALLRSRLAGFFLLIVLVLGLMNSVSILYEAQHVKDPDQILTESSGIVYGRVTDPEGVGIPDAEVTVVGTSNNAYTDSDGWYFITSVPVKEYKVEADKANYTSIIKKVKVEEQMPRPVNFQLSRGSGIKEVPTRVPEEMGDLQQSYALSAIASVVGAVFAGIGAILCFKRTRFKTALLCSAIGVLSYGFLIGLVLSVLALMLIVSARAGFIPLNANARSGARSAKGAFIEDKAGVKTRTASTEDGQVPADGSDVLSLEVPDGTGKEDVTKDVLAPELRSLSARKSETELGASETRQTAKAHDEPIQDAEVKELLVSKGYESEGGPVDIDGEIDVHPKKREIRSVGPEVVTDMEQALKSTMESQDDTETDIVASVLKKLELDQPVARVMPPKKSTTKKKGLKAHQERLLCRECVKPIILESEAIRCKCGRTYHIHCANGIRNCKNCGRPFRT